MLDRVAGLRASLVEVTATVAETADRARHRWRTVDALFAARDRDRQVVGGVLAGAMAFRLFVYLLPLFLVVISVLGIVAGYDASAAGDVSEDLGMSTYLIDSVDSAADESQDSLWALVPLALWATYSAGVGTVKVLRAIHALAWGQPVRKLRRAGLAAAAAFGVVALLVVVVAGTQALRQRSEGAGLGFAVAQVAIVVGLWWAVSRALPHDPDAGWSALLPGALLVGVGAWGLHLAGVYLLARRVASASELYGSLGVAAALLLWLYLLGRLVVAAAMVNATLWERRAGTV